MQSSLQALEAAVSSRDLTVLGWTADQYAIRADRLSFLWPSTMAEGPRPVSSQRVQQVVARWQQAGLVEQRRILADMPRWVWPSVRGIRIAGLPWPYRTPPPGRLAHIDAVGVVRLFIEREWGADGWICERALFAERAEGEHVPDGVWIRNGRHHAIEVELGLKSRVRMEAILADLLGRWQSVLYVVSSSAIADALREVSGGDRRVEIRHLSKLRLR